MVPLGEVAKIARKGVDPVGLASTTPYIGLEHVERGGRLISSSTVGKSAVSSTKFAFSEGDVLFGKLRPNLAKVLQPGFAGVCSTDILPVRPGPHLDSRYLLHFLRDPETVALASTRTSGANLPRLAPFELSKFELPLPPLAEQRRIAAILDHADALRAKRREQELLLSETLDAEFALRFRGRDYPRVALDDVVGIIDSGVSPVCESRPAAAHEAGVLKLGAVTYGTYRATENKAYLGDLSLLRGNEVRAGDVLMTRKNTPELVGAVAVVSATPAQRYLPDLIFRLRLDHARVDPWFFQSMMMSASTRSRVRQLAGGSAASMSNISKERLRRFVVALPPIAEQRSFARTRLSLESQHKALARAGLEMDQLFASLQHRAFRGEL